MSLQISNKINEINKRLITKKKTHSVEWVFEVVPPGIEPGTHGFSVHCSTN